MTPKKDVMVSLFNPKILVEDKARMNIISDARARAAVETLHKLQPMYMHSRTVDRNL